MASRAPRWRIIEACSRGRPARPEIGPDRGLQRAWVSLARVPPHGASGGHRPVLTTGSLDRISFHESGDMSDRAFAETLAGAQVGEEQAVTVLWRAHHPRLLSVLASRHAADDVDDLASEVWLRVTGSWHRF